MNADQREEAVARPCLIVAHGDETYAALVSRSFRRLGWDTYLARTGPEARRMARLLGPDMMVMAADLEGESGWLTCEKVRCELPRVKVFLIGDASERLNHAFAEFLGAVAFLDRGDSIQTLVDEVCGRDLPAAG